MGLVSPIVVAALMTFFKWYVYFQPDTSPVFVSEPQTSYDYIVVGAGSAGAVVANRLSEDPQVTVLLVEEGGDDFGDPFLQMPGLASLIPFFDRGVVVNYFSEPEDKYTGLKDKQVKWMRGKVLGGTSSINYMMYVRGSRSDYNLWAADIKDNSWDYKHVLAYFKKSEKINNPELFKSPFHGKDGLLGVKRKSVTSFIGQKLLKGFHELNYTYNEDYNGKTMEGITVLQENVVDGERASTGLAFLSQIRDRPNLNIALNSRVTKVLIKNKKAEGVELIKDNRKFIAKATKEVILSAGAIGSPQILMLSGIGPKKHLEKLNITVVADLNVGENLQDHTLFDVPISFNDPGHTTSDWIDSIEFIKHLLFKEGRMASHGNELALYTSVFKDGVFGQPDMQIVLSTRGFNPGTQFLAAVNVNPELIKDYSYRDKVGSSFVCAPIVVRPKSRGSLRLRSADPLDSVQIFPNYYSNEKDVDTMYRGIEICTNLLKTQPMREIGAKLVDTTPLKICNEHKVLTKEHWSCIMKSRPFNIFHQAGTCKMGVIGDATSVVDPKLRVIGVDRLRVADASIMPKIVSGNPNAAAIMIGEKAADLIRGKELEPVNIA